MTANSHDRAKQLCALGDALSPAEQAWLQSHLNACPPCAQYAEAAREMVFTLRSLPVVADSRLVRATQMRVRFHAAALRQTRERMWLVGTACLGVGLSATFTLPLFWRLFAWLGAWAGVHNVVWQSAFLFFFLVPALVFAVFLLARGADIERSRPSR